MNIEKIPFNRFWKFGLAVEKDIPEKVKEISNFFLFTTAIDWRQISLKGWLKQGDIVSTDDLSATNGTPI